MSFDTELGRALRRKEPPPGFAARALAQIAVTRRRKPAPARWIAVALGIAASLVMTIAGVRFYVHRQEVREAERVTREVEIALRITSEKLNEVQLKIADISAKRGASHDDPVGRSKQD